MIEKNITHPPISSISNKTYLFNTIASLTLTVYYLYLYCAVKKFIVFRTFGLAKVIGYFFKLKKTYNFASDDC